MSSHNPAQPILVNIRFLSPAILVLYSTIVFLLCLPILPIDVYFPITIEAFFFWVICFLGYFIGSMIGAGSRFKMAFSQRKINVKKVRHFLLSIVMIGFFGVILFVVDRFFIRGVSMAANAMENREILLESKASVLSMIAALASSFGILSYIVIWFTKLRLIVISPWLKLIALFNVLSTVLMSVLLGSRSLMLVILLTHILAWFFVFRIRGGKVRSKHLLIILFMLFSLALISSSIMISRVELMDISMQYSLQYSAYGYTISPSSFVFEFFRDFPDISELIAGLFSLVQYIFHGIYEFSLLFNSFQGDHELGRRTFWLPVKLLSISTGGWVQIDGVINSGVRFGIFTTFVGPIFIDFGWFSPIILVVLGAVNGLPFRLLQQGKLEWLPAAALVATSSILWPIVNIFSSASGIYLLVVALIIGLMGWRLRI